jgi:hypothetical protein
MSGANASPKRSASASAAARSLKTGRSHQLMNQSVISKIADAIAFAEGYLVAGSRPRRNNNPGDLERDLTGKAIGRDGRYVIYATPEDGREALEHQVRLMFDGSHIYKPFMTIAEIARLYTATNPEVWASNVAGHLGVNVRTRLDEVRR